MTPQDALQLIDQATSMLQLNRADHDKIREALMVLAAAVENRIAEVKSKD